MTTAEMVGAPVVAWWKGMRGEWYVAIQAALSGAVQLAFGRSLSALPCPKDSATLVDTGVFAFVRHPMYCGRDARTHRARP